MVFYRRLCNFAENIDFMERIKLTNDEKIVFRIVADLAGVRPCTYPEHIFNLCVRSLCRKGLVRASFLTDGSVWTVSLTEEGRLYRCENPQLRNPIDWKLISGVVIPLLALAVSIVALFMCCTRL